MQNKITKDSLFEALMLLMDKKGFHDISVTELTKKAGVSRMAFYRNYNYKEDIIKKFLDELFDDFYRELIETEINGQFQTACRYFSYCRKHKDIIGILIRSNMTYLLEERYTKFIPFILEKDHVDKLHEEKDLPYVSGFTSGGLYRLTILWSRGGMKESDEKMAALLSKIVK